MLLVGVAKAQAPGIPENGRPYVEEQYVLDWKGLMSKNMLLVANCESGLRTDAYSFDGGAEARGIMQITRRYHPEVSDECTFDPVCAIEWSLTRNPVEWTCARTLSVKNW